MKTTCTRHDWQNTVIEIRGQLTERMVCIKCGKSKKFGG